MADQNLGNRNPPVWTEAETSLLVEAWREVELNTTYASRFYERSSIDKQICARLAGRCCFSRSPASIAAQREKIRAYLRFVHTFDVGQQASGGRTWFELSQKERDRTKTPVKVRNASRTVTQACFNMLVELDIVNKYSKTKASSEYGAAPAQKGGGTSSDGHQRRQNSYAGSKRSAASAQYASLLDNREDFVQPKEDTLRSGEEAEVQGLVTSPSLSRSRWAPSEVTSLIRACGRVLKAMQIPLGNFVQEPFKLFAELYTPRNRPSVLAWRKMKRLVVSYLYIRDFGKRHGPEQWFELPGATRDARMDWLELPDDFEDISRGVFDELQDMDRHLQGISSPVAADLRPGGQQCEAQSPLTDELEEGEVETEPAVSSDADDRDTTSMLDSESSDSPVAAAEVPRQHTPRPSSLAGNEKTGVVMKHRNCNVFLGRVMKQQTEQFRQATHKLRADVERETRRMVQTLSTTIQERVGAPDADEDAHYLVHLLEAQQQQIRGMFARFREARSRDEIANKALLGQRFEERNN